ncbi:MAG TPA: ATP-binding protein [Candidatus Sumerlaeota bacterium]|nr:ATP-binding protein [Candidatus Sumerlaeota bacterium]
MQHHSARAPQPGGDYHFEVYCPVDTSLLNILRRFVSSVAEAMGFGDEEIDKIEMAVNEACTNVALHAYRDLDRRPDGKPGIELRLSLAPDCLTISIQDRGCGLAAAIAESAITLQDYHHLDRTDYHGLGVLIMKEFMDEVQFSSEPDAGTIVTLRKYIRPGAGQV